MDLTSTAQLLGNFGEFFGAIAVVATLGYLAYQIRQNTQSSYASTLRNVGSDLARIYEQILANDELAELIARCRNATTDLSPSESERIQFLATLYLIAYSSVEIAYQENQMPQGIYETYRNDFRRVVTTYPALKPRMREGVESDQVADLRPHGIYQPLFE